MKVLTVNHVTQRFGGLTALSDINLEIREHEIVGVIGPNGAGKSTLFNVITGMYAPTEGDVYLGVEKTAHGVTTRYESVIGTGECRFLSAPEEILHGLKLLTEHYCYFDYPLERCAGLKHLLVGRIALDEISGKRNLPGASTPADQAVK